MDKHITFKADDKVHRDCKRLAKKMKMRLGWLIEEGMRLVLVKYAPPADIKQ